MAVQHDFVPQGCVEIPLYTHPVKELTLDDLKELFAQSNIQTEFSHSIVDFARAILRKAQEK
jgi:hypothetical protein